MNESKQKDRRPLISLVANQNFNILFTEGNLTCCYTLLEKPVDIWMVSNKKRIIYVKVPESAVS